MPQVPHPARLRVDHVKPSTEAAESGINRSRTAEASSLDEDFLYVLKGSPPAAACCAVTGRLLLSGRSRPAPPTRAKPPTATDTGQTLRGEIDQPIRFSRE
ncbi:hypothetical protein Skr01_36750 [Sphaerisporangium krabiense]|nr:hypothetical protein Skr01_36750 [Sphaerisporangium krabiense]